MVFTDDLILSDTSKEKMEERLEKWKSSLEDAGLKVSRSKTEHLPPLTSLEKIRMRQYEGNNHTDLPTTTTFKYLGKRLQ